MPTLISYSRKLCTVTKIPDKEKRYKILFHIAISIALNLKRIINPFKEYDLALFVRK